MSKPRAVFVTRYGRVAHVTPFCDSLANANMSSLLQVAVAENVLPICQRCEGLTEEELRFKWEVWNRIYADLPEDHEAARRRIWGERLNRHQATQEPRSPRPGPTPTPSPTSNLKLLGY
jgi:hypothetical protein